MPRNSEIKVSYVTVSIPEAIGLEIDYVLDYLGYWPSRSSFVREACLEKIKVEKKRIQEIRQAGEAD